MAICKSVGKVVVVLVAMAAAVVSGQNTAQDFVRLHNRVRGVVGIGRVSWDAKLASYAQGYAARRAGDCGLVNSGGPYGENIFQGSSGARSWSAADAVGRWAAEKRWYHYGSNSCDLGKACGHYTQVVWRKSTRIGCARVVCAAGRGVFIVCSYDPPGNLVGERPY